MGLLDGKVAIVTGAGRGIGRGEALLLAAEGARVVVNDLGTTLDGAGADTSVAQTVVEEITAAGGTAVANQDDVASWEGARRLVDHAVESFGDLNILVNNAGFVRDRMSFNMDEDDFDSVVRVHLKGHFAPSRFAASYWRSRSKAGEPVYGRVINTTSEAGLWGTPGQANYAAAKGAIYSMTLVLARELERLGVTVNAVAPRARTRMTETLGGGFSPDQPAEGFDDLHPDNIAPAVVWLASESAGDISGQVFMVTGGRVHLIDGFSEAAAVSKEGRWTAAELVEAQEKLFSGRRRGTPGFGIGA
ncbi:MAG TPA: SDR family oxidoreductase [Acidimicrobiales bacterium]|nr:SDR family oxidoreductase [Acidimicrobiales bacterium]